MADSTTTTPPRLKRHSILLWDVGGVEHDGKEAWEVCFVLETQYAAEAWRAWLKQEAPGKGE